MLKAYYRIWVDAIVFEKQKRKEESEWKLFLMVAMPILQGLNLLVLLFILRAFTHGTMPILLPVSIFNIRAINGFISIILTFFLPFLILNYLLIFYNNRYKALMVVYQDKKGKLYRNYFFISAGLIIIPLIIKFVF